MALKMIALALVPSVVFAAIGHENPLVFSFVNPPLRVPAACENVPKNVTIADCCSTPMLMSPNILRSCQDEQVRWLEDEEGSRCGSQCIVEELIGQLKETSPPSFLTLLSLPQWVSSYWNALTSCASTLDFERVTSKLAENPDARENAICHIDLQAVFDCFNRELLLNSPVKNDSKVCQEVNRFLSVRCLYRDLTDEGFSKMLSQETDNQNETSTETNMSEISE